MADKNGRGWNWAWPLNKCTTHIIIYRPATANWVVGRGMNQTGTHRHQLVTRKTMGSSVHWVRCLGGPPEPFSEVSGCAVYRTCRKIPAVFLASLFGSREPGHAAHHPSPPATTPHKSARGSPPKSPRPPVDGSPRFACACVVLPVHDPHPILPRHPPSPLPPLLPAATARRSARGSPPKSTRPPVATFADVFPRFACACHRRLL